METIHSASHSFFILGLEIELLSSETEYGWMTAAIVNDNLPKDKSEFNNYIYHLDNELISLETAFDVWQYLKNRMLTAAEIKTAMEVNRLLIPENV